MDDVLMHLIWISASITPFGERPLEHPVAYEPCPPMSHARASYIARETVRYFHQLLGEDPKAQEAMAVIQVSREGPPSTFRQFVSSVALINDRPLALSGMWPVSRGGEDEV